MEYSIRSNISMEKNLRRNDILLMKRIMDILYRLKESFLAWSESVVMFQVILCKISTHKILTQIHSH